MSTKENKTQNKKEDEVILIRAIIEMLGAPREHIEKTLKEYVYSLKEDKDIRVVKEYLAPAEEKEKLFSNYAELEIWMKNPEKLIEFCFDSLPSSIEILEPEELHLASNRFAGLLNDLQARLHKLDSALKRYITDQKVGSKNFVNIINNFILQALRSGINTPEGMAKTIGIEQDRIEKWCNDLAERKVIYKNGNTYSLQA